MRLQELRDSMKEVLKPSRYLHSLGTEEVSYDLALIYGCDTRKARIAGILHDCAKGKTEEELIEECNRYELPLTQIELQNTALLHAKVGAVYAREIYGIEDDGILNAIKYHTTGRPAMTMLEKIVFTADYIEPNRKMLPGMEEIRRLSYENIDRAIVLILADTLEHLKVSGDAIDTLAMDTYVYYKGITS